MLRELSEAERLELEAFIIRVMAKMLPHFLNVDYHLRAESWVEDLDHDAACLRGVNPTAYTPPAMPVEEA